MRSVWIILLGLTLAGWTWAAGSFEAAASRAGLAATRGKVEKCQQGTWSACQVGDLLGPGDRIRTGPGSLAMVLLDDLTSLRLSAQSELVLISLEPEASQCQLVTGRVWAHVNPERRKASTFELKGPNAVACVKGTSFEMTDTLVRVWDGRVDCSDRIVETGQEYRGGEVLAADLRNPDAFQSWNRSCDGTLQSVALVGLTQVALNPSPAITGPVKAITLPDSGAKASPARAGASPAQPSPSPVASPSGRSALTADFLRQINAELPPWLEP